MFAALAQLTTRALSPDPATGHESISPRATGGETSDAGLAGGCCIPVGVPFRCLRLILQEHQTSAGASGISERAIFHLHPHGQQLSRRPWNRCWLEPSQTPGRRSTPSPAKRALETARQLSVGSVALLGEDGDKAKGKADLELTVAGPDPGRIQEAQTLILHALLEAIEQARADQFSV
jgi:hypothetical protein